MVSSLRRLRFYRAVAMAALLLTEPIMPGLAQSESKCTGNPDVPPEREIAGRTNAIQSGKYSGKDLSSAYHNRGSAHYGKGDFDRSIADYSEAVRLDPKSASAYGGRGLAYFDKGDFDRAIADYNEAIKLDPKSASFYNKSASVYYNGRGATYSDKGDFDRAMADLNEAIKLDPKYALAYYNRGIAYFDKGDYDRAIADYSEAIRFDPKFIPAYTNRGDAYSTKGDYERAIAAYSEAINVDPKSVIAYLHRGLAYFDKGDDDRAIADSTEAIKRDGKSVFAYQVRGIVYLYANSLAQAQADFKQATELSPKYAYAALWLDIAERRSNLPSHLVAAAKRLDMGAWPAPLVRLFLGEATPAAVLSAADHADPIKKKGRICEANLFGAEYALLQNKREEAVRLYRLAASDCPPIFLEAGAAKAALARGAK
jgi:tetratricopeptide (TPR) repeat protein